MRIAAVGDNCMDVYDNIGEAYPGGNPVNVAVYFVRLGGEASYTGVVGTDRYGSFMKRKISEKGVNTSHIRFEEGNTAVTHLELINGERVLGDYDEGVLSGFKLTCEEKDFLCTHDMIVTALWGNIHNELSELKSRGMKIAFDAATRPDDPAALAAIPSVDYLFFASDNGDTEELRRRMKLIREKGPKLVIVTLGHKGSLVYDGERYIKFGIIPCQVVDSIGAGDSYIAGFLKGILENNTIEECMKMGALNSSITLRYKGAW